MLDDSEHLRRRLLDERARGTANRVGQHSRPDLIDDAVKFANTRTRVGENASIEEGFANGNSTKVRTILKGPVTQGVDRNYNSVAGTSGNLDGVITPTTVWAVNAPFKGDVAIGDNKIRNVITINPLYPPVVGAALTISFAYGLGGTISSIVTESDGSTSIIPSVGPGANVGVAVDFTLNSSTYAIPAPYNGLWYFGFNLFVLLTINGNYAPFPVAGGSVAGSVGARIDVIDGVGAILSSAVLTTSYAVNNVSADWSSGFTSYVEGTEKFASWNGIVVTASGGSPDYGNYSAFTSIGGVLGWINIDNQVIDLS